jgi:hypothetical protein
VVKGVTSRPPLDMLNLWYSVKRKLTWFGGIYILLVLALALPWFQKQ